MSFRTKVLLSISLTVLFAVWLVAFAASSILTRSFEERETRRTAAVFARFNREVDRRAAEVARRVAGVFRPSAHPPAFVRGARDSPASCRIRPLHPRVRPPRRRSGPPRRR